jgi:hypothetical protein
MFSVSPMHRHSLDSRRCDRYFSSCFDCESTPPPCWGLVVIKIVCCIVTYSGFSIRDGTLLHSKSQYTTVTVCSYYFGFPYSCVINHRKGGGTLDVATDCVLRYESILLH